MSWNRLRDYRFPLAASPPDRVITAASTVTVLVLLVLIAVAGDTYVRVGQLEADVSEIKTDLLRIGRLDEETTRSARMAIVTGDSSWLRRHAEAKTALFRILEDPPQGRRGGCSRTPLNAILGFGQMLEMDLHDDGDRESVEQILSAGKHLLSLVDQILDLSPIETGQLSVITEDVFPGEVIESAIDMVRPLAARRQLTIDVESLLEPVISVRCDAARLRQVLLNLLSNAIKYNVDRGSVKVICDLPRPDRVRIVIRDTGVGIADAHQARLFTPFYRADSERHGIPDRARSFTVQRAHRSNGWHSRG